MRINPGLETGYAEDKVAIDSNGNKVVVTNWILSDDEFQQVRQGYRCLKCMEVFRDPFPERCLVCDYPVRDRQSQDLAREHRGEQHYGPTPLSVVYDRADEQDERDNWKQTGTGIIVPRTIKETP